MGERIHVNYIKQDMTLISYEHLGNIYHNLCYGKIDYYNTGRKINAVEVEVRLEKGRLSIIGKIWNMKHTYVVRGGQCQDEIRHIIGEKLYNIWNRWHLNDRAGVPAQMECLRKLDPERKLDYEGQCKLLEDNNLLVVDGYRYGTAWIREELPEDVVDYIRNLGILHVLRKHR